MLIEFSVGNFRSFKDKVTLSMEAAKLRSKNHLLDEKNIAFINQGKLNLLKSAAIYGANASGKSNLIKAIDFARDFILASSKESQIEEEIDVENFLLTTDTIHKPSFFEFAFLHKNKKYRYGFEVDSERIHHEWLYHVPTAREARIFEREGQVIKLSGRISEARALINRTRENALFLSVMAQFNIQLATEILGWFRTLGIVSGVSDLGIHGYTMQKFQDKEFAKRAEDLLTQLDVGISGLKVDERPVEGEENEIFGVLVKALLEVLPSEQADQMRKLQESGFKLPVVSTEHTLTDPAGVSIAKINFSLDEQESEGTKRLFYLLGPILRSIDNGSPLIVDELDARLHPLLTIEIINLYNSIKGNKKNAQLIFTTHDTNLLMNTLFRRDQIWFTEKNSIGATDLYSLAELKVRNDASFEKDYITGKYGAIPFIGDLEQLLESM